MNGTISNNSDERGLLPYPVILAATKGDPADGVYGEGTAKAVAQYQSDHGLNPTGVADAETQKMLLGAT